MKYGIIKSKFKDWNLQKKVVHLEDRSQRNNLRINGTNGKKTEMSASNNFVHFLKINWV